MSLSADFFIHKDKKEDCKVKVDKTNDYYVLDIGDVAIFNVELIKDRLIEELNKIEDK